MVSDRARDPAEARPPRPRFKSEEERQRHRNEISRKKHARMVNETFSPRSLYSTLTLDNEHEVHTFREAKRLRDNFCRRLQYSCPDAKISIYCGRGKNTQRIHFHLLSDGVPKEVIAEKWGMGEILRIEHLREHVYYDGVDHGPDYTGLANYLFDHWTPDQGGHRWKQSRNVGKPQREARVVKTHFHLGRPPQPPKGYILVEQSSTPYGYFYFKYVRAPEKRVRTEKKIR